MVRLRLLSTGRHLTLRAQAHTEAAQSVIHNVTFHSTDKKRPCELEGHLLLSVIAGPPAVWSINAPGATTQAASLDEEGDVRCNSWMHIEVDVADKHMNKCAQQRRVSCCVSCSNAAPACARHCCTHLDMERSCKCAPLPVDMQVCTAASRGPQ